VPVVSNIFAGKSARLEQKYQAALKATFPAPFEKSNEGKLVRLEHDCHAPRKFVPLEVSIVGKLVRLEQLFQVLKKPVKVEVAFEAVKSVILLAPLHASSRVVPKFIPSSISTEVI
jgi:hypothetical protein